MKKIAPLMFMETKNEGEKLFRVTTTTMCPVCDAIWMFQYLSWAKEPKDIEGLVPGGIEGRELWTISTAKWGVHALCGECRARNLANYVKRIPGQSSKTLKLWTSASITFEMAQIAALSLAEATRLPVEISAVVWLRLVLIDFIV